MEKKRRFKKALGVLIISGALVGLGYGMSPVVKSYEANATSSNSDSIVPMIPGNFSNLAESVRAGVVNIQVTKTVRKVGFDLPSMPGSPFGDFFGPFSKESPPEGHEQRGVGSGFVVSPDGYILTNNHVVENADQITVKMADGKEYIGKVVGRDPKTDLALIKIDGASDLEALKLGDSDKLKVGNWVVAIGSPFGLDQTVTAGIVSAKGRAIGSGPYDDYIQTDASINPGNSGGPLLNTSGEVVGINTAIYSQNGGNVGIGFAIPINMAKEIATQLKETGHVTRGWLGTVVQKITPELAKSFGLKEERGALVSQVAKGGPADKAGIETGDVIVQFDGKKIADTNDLARTVATTPVGKVVTVKVMRKGDMLDRQVTIGQLAQKGAVADVSSHRPLGMTLQDLTPEIVRSLGLKSDEGAVITSVVPGSPAEKAGLRAGDVIVQINREQVKDLENAKEMIEKAKDRESILLLVERGENTLFAAITVPKA
jgi:serine protease Do